MNCCDGKVSITRTRNADKVGVPELLTIQHFRHLANCRPPLKILQKPKQLGSDHTLPAAASPTGLGATPALQAYADLPTSELPDLASVFQRCGIPNEAVPFDMTDAAGLRNFVHLSRPEVEQSGFGTKGLYWPRTLPDLGQDAQLLPVEDLLQRCLARLGSTKKTDPTLGGRLFQNGIESEKPSKRDMFKWFCNILGRQHQKHPPLIMNILMTGKQGNFTSSELWGNTSDFEASNAEAISTWYDHDDRAEIERANANLTPRYSLVQAHHDEDLGIFTLRTLQPVGPVSSSNNNPHRTPGKLWIFWPPSQLPAFANHDQDTAYCLHNLHHGVFILQADGETMLVPPYLPHVVFTLETCYLAGSTVQTHDGRFLDRRLQSGFICDAVIGGPKDDPWQLHRRLRDDLEDALSNPEIDVGVIALLWRNSQTEIVEHFVECPELWEEMRGIWQECIRKDVKACPFCLLKGFGGSALLAGPAKRHVDLHIVRVEVKGRGIVRGAGRRKKAGGGKKRTRDMMEEDLMKLGR